jgi:hypothetical protein
MLKLEGNRPCQRGEADALGRQRLGDVGIPASVRFRRPALTPRPLGFRILDVSEQGAFRWKLGDENP